MRLASLSPVSIADVSRGEFGDTILISRNAFRVVGMDMALPTPDTFAAQLHSFYRHIGLFGFKQKRRKSPNSIRMIALISELYHWDTKECISDLTLDITLT